MSGPFEWRLQDIERKADEAVRRLHEIDSLRSDVGSVERNLLELRSEIDGLRNEFQTYQDQTARDLADLREMFEAMQSEAPASHCGQDAKG